MIKFSFHLIIFLFSSISVFAKDSRPINIETQLKYQLTGYIEELSNGNKSHLVTSKETYSVIYIISSFNISNIEKINKKYRAQITFRTTKRLLQNEGCPISQYEKSENIELTEEVEFEKLKTNLHFIKPLRAPFVFEGKADRYLLNPTLCK